MAKYTLYSVSATVLGTADTLDKARAKAIKIIREHNPTGTGRFKQINIWTKNNSVGAVVFSKVKIKQPNPYYPVGQKFISFRWWPNTFDDDILYDLNMDGTIAHKYTPKSEGSSHLVYKGKRVSDQKMVDYFNKTHIKV